METGVRFARWSLSTAIPLVLVLAACGGEPASDSRASAAEAPFPGHNGRFVIADNGSLYLLEGATRRDLGGRLKPRQEDWERPPWETEVTGNGFTVFAEATWSPDGRFIAFTGGLADYFGLWIVRPDGRGMRNLAPVPDTSSSSACCPIWSPDGKQVMFAYGGDHREAFMIRPGSRARLVRSNVDHLGGWSKKNLILYTELHRIRVMRPNGRAARTIAYGSDPDWSPDGEQVVFESSGQIHIVNADGTKRRVLTSGRARRFSPAWSPDGRRIAFLEENLNGCRLWTTRVDGRDRRPVLRNACSGDFSPGFDWVGRGARATRR